MENYESGMRLPNGAVYIDSRQGERLGIVLGRLDGYWVTWEFRVDDPGSTYMGNYFSSLTNAVEDFDRRVEEVTS